MVFSLVSLGTVAYDSVETPFGRVERALGGSGTYFSLASSFFVESGLVSVVGGDFDDADLDVLRGRGVDTEGVEVAEGDTFHWSGYYENDMNCAHTRRTDLNVLASFDPKVPQSYHGCDYLFLANIDPVLQLKVLEDVQPRYSLCDTMDFWISSKKSDLTKVFEVVDAIILNEGEARMYCGTPNLIRAGRELTQLCGGPVIIKKGEHGALLFRDREFFAVPGYPVADVVDPTGAGDSFAGGTIGHLAKHGKLELESLKKSMVLGSVVASYVVESFSIGAVKDKTQKDIETRYNDFRQIVSFDHTLE